jgi:hypothetical protein
LIHSSLAVQKATLLPTVSLLDMMHNWLTLNTSTTIGNISAFAFFILVKLSTGLTIPFLLRNSLTSVWVDLWSLGSAASCRIARSLLELMNYPLLVAKYCTNISIFIIYQFVLFS